MVNCIFLFIVLSKPANFFVIYAEVKSTYILMHPISFSKNTKTTWIYTHSSNTHNIEYIYLRVVLVFVVKKLWKKSDKKQGSEMDIQYHHFLCTSPKRAC